MSKEIKVNDKWSLSKYKKKLWSAFSVYIRIRDKGKCFSCLKIIPAYYHRSGLLLPGWKAGQAGHFITAKSCGLALYFHEKNVHCQCHHCNINLSGNWVEYELQMIKKYGKKEVEALKKLKWTGNVKYTKMDYAEKIEHYNKLVGSS